MFKFLTTPHWQTEGRVELTTNISIDDFSTEKPIRFNNRNFPHYLLIAFDTEYESINKISRDGNWRDVGDDVKEEYKKNRKQLIEGELLNRVLCYSFSISCIRRPEPVHDWDADIKELRVWTYSGIIYPRSYEFEDKLSLKEFISAALTMSREKWYGKYDLPTDVYIISHFTKADLPAFQEFKQEDEKYKLGLSALRNTFVSMKDKYTPEIQTVDEPIKLKIKFRDTYLLAPQAKRKLADLGEMLGHKKVVLHKDDRKEKNIKENMTKYFEENLGTFEKYAIIDSVICREYAEKVLIQQFNLTGIWNVPITLTGIGTARLDQLWEHDRILPSTLEIVGKEHHDYKRWSGTKGKQVRIKEDKFVDKVWWNQDFAISGYHGGRNEQFQFGVSSKDDWYDWDLESAYPTAMNVLGLPDWDNLKYLTSKEEVYEYGYDDLVFVAVNFKFKDDVRYPCLPTRAENTVLFPASGYSICGIQELKVAIEEDLLETWDFVHGVYVPTDKQKPIFNGYLNYCVSERLKAKKRKDEFGDKFWKELVNATYGKTAQGLRERKVFDLRDLDNKPLPPSKYTNPFIAGFITSFVRGTLAEVLNRLPPHITVLNVITDGFLTNANEEMVLKAAEGGIGSIFTKSAKSLGKEQAFGLKHKAKQVLGFRTRGSATIEFADEGVDGEKDSDFILQRGSIKLLDTYTKRQDNLAIIDLFLDRTSNQQIATTNAMGIRDMWLDGNDLTDKMIIKSLSMEYDYKRKPVNIREEKFMWNGVERTHLTYDTVPWRNLQEYQRLKLHLEEYNRYTRKVLKTKSDYKDMLEYMRSKEGSHKKSYIPTKTGSIGRLKQELCSAYYQYQGGIRIVHKIKADEYAKILRDSGVECRVKDVYNGKKRVFTKFNVPSTKEVMEALEKVSEHIPTIRPADFLSELGEDVMLDDVDL